MNSIEYLSKGYWMGKRHPYACGIELTPNCNMLPICMGGCVYERKLTGIPYCFTAKSAIEQYILEYYKEAKRNEGNQKSYSD